jgi:Trehalose utilisation
MLRTPIKLLTLLTVLITLSVTSSARAADRLVFDPPSNPSGKHIVLVAGDEEYRTEESMPMLAKILSQKHGFKCTVVFSLGPNGASYIDANHSAGLRGLDALESADLMIIGTRFRNPTEEEAKHIGNFLNAGKPVIGTRTATHAFKGKGNFGGLPYDDFGLKILGETWVSHHGQHKKQGARGVIETSQADHPVLRGVKDIFALSDVYGVIHLGANDQILMRAAVTESLDPKSPNISGEKNSPMQPFVWLHDYDRPNGSGKGKAFCTTAGASVDFINADLRRLIVNASYYLTGREVPAMADVAFVDPFHPSFYGFINEPDYWKNTNLKPDDLGLGKAPKLPDPVGSPKWKFSE